MWFCGPASDVVAGTETQWDDPLEPPADPRTNRDDGRPKQRRSDRRRRFSRRPYDRAVGLILRRLDTQLRPAMADGERTLTYMPHVERRQNQFYPDGPFPTLFVVTSHALFVLREPGYENGTRIPWGLFTEVRFGGNWLTLNARGVEQDYVARISWGKTGSAIASLVEEAGGRPAFEQLAW